MISHGLPSKQKKAKDPVSTFHLQGSENAPFYFLFQRPFSIWFCHNNTYLQNFES